MRRFLKFGTSIFFLFVVVVLYCTDLLYAKSLLPGKQGGHEADIYGVLPFRRQPKVNKMILMIHNSIDMPTGYFPGLKRAPHQNFTWHRYGHRVFFHWGFNSDPRSSKILNELVSECKWSADVEEQFWKKVVDEQAIRNKSNMETVAAVLGYSLSGVERGYVNAVASLIVDTHILGDYTTTETRSLQDIDMLAADIQKALFSSLRGGDAAKSINKRIDKTASLTPAAVRAEAILAILQSDMPTFWEKAQEGAFIKHFRGMGLIVK
jgi:hypothetical protein